MCGNARKQYDIVYKANMHGLEVGFTKKMVEWKDRVCDTCNHGLVAPKCYKNLKVAKVCIAISSSPYIIKLHSRLCDNIRLLKT